MKKRITLWLLTNLFLANVSLADAQQTGKIFRIGFLDSSNASGMAGLLGAFQQELNKLGWIEGKNITIEKHWAAATCLVYFLTPEIISQSWSTLIDGAFADSLVMLLFLSFSWHSSNRDNKLFWSVLLGLGLVLCPINNFTQSH